MSETFRNNQLQHFVIKIWRGQVFLAIVFGGLFCGYLMVNGTVIGPLLAVPFLLFFCYLIEKELRYIHDVDVNSESIYSMTSFENFKLKEIEKVSSKKWPVGRWVEVTIKNRDKPIRFICDVENHRLLISWTNKYLPENEKI